MSAGLGPRGDGRKGARRAQAMVRISAQGERRSPELLSLDGGWERRSAHGGYGDGGAARARLERLHAWRRPLPPRPSTIRAPPSRRPTLSPPRPWWPSRPRRRGLTTITTTAGLAPLSPPRPLRRSPMLAPALALLPAPAPARRPWMLFTTAARLPRRRPRCPSRGRRYGIGALLYSVLFCVCLICLLRGRANRPRIAPRQSLGGPRMRGARGDCAGWRLGLQFWRPCGRVARAAGLPLGGGPGLVRFFRFDLICATTGALTEAGADPRILARVSVLLVPASRRR